jgi:hypothetical protein
MAEECKVANKYKISLPFQIYGISSNIQKSVKIMLHNKIIKQVSEFK